MNVKSFCKFFFLLLVILGVFSCGNDNNQNEKSRANIEKVDSLLTNVREKFQGYETAGYSFEDAIFATIDYLKSQSDVSEAGVGDDGTTIIFTHSSGLEGFFVTDVRDEGLEIGDGALKAALQRFSSSLTLGGKAAIFEAPDFSSIDANKIKEILEGAGFSVDYYPKEKFTCEAVKKFGLYRVILVAAHGGIAKGGKICFVTGEETSIPLKDYDIAQYGIDVEGIGIGSYDEASSNYYVVCPAYFDYQNINFQSGSLLFMNICHGLQTESMAEKLVNRGLGIYLGWTETVIGECAYNTVGKFFQRMIKGYTADEVVTQGKNDDTYFGKCLFYDEKTKRDVYAELNYYPNSASDFKLNATEKPNGKIGDPCEKDGDCESGLCAIYDNTEPELWVDGYCTTDSSCYNCPDEAKCIKPNPLLPESPPADFGWCLKRCNNLNSDCRNGYFCYASKNNGFGVCLPNTFNELPEGAYCGEIFEGMEFLNCRIDIKCILSQGQEWGYCVK